MDNKEIEKTRGKEAPRQITEITGVHTGHRARMRESVARDTELSAFSDVELLELLLAFSVPRRDTNVLAHKLIDKFGSLAGVLDATKAELAGVSGMTAASATVIDLLRAVIPGTDCADIRLTDRRGAIDFFALLFIGGNNFGTYAAFMDEDFRVAAIEFFDGEDFPIRGVIRSVCKHAAKYVFLARRVADIFACKSAASESVSRLAGLFDAVGARLLDCVMLIDNGYYTVGPQPPSGEWSPTYVFVPAKIFTDSAELYTFAMNRRVPPLGSEPSSDDMRDWLAQVRMAVSRK